MRNIGSYIALSLTIALVGCAAQFNPVGEVKFDCNRKQDAQSPYCRSYKSLEQSTTGKLPPSRFDRAFSIEEFDRLTGIAPDAQTPQANGAAINTNSTAAPAAPIRLPHQVRDDAPLAGQPVRQGPVVQRVWIKRFVDGRDVLTENTVVYKEIQGNRWAGFDAKRPEEIQRLNAYPHRPVEPIKDPAPDLKQASDNNNTPKTATTQEFKQPGTPPESAESAPEPAARGSMPN